MIIDVLGTGYDLSESNEQSDPRLVAKDGYCDTSVKQCVVDEMKPGDIHEKQDLEYCKRHVQRHELIHAFLFESGVDVCCEWATEGMVDWVAIQAPKLFEAFKAADAM